MKKHYLVFASMLAAYLNQAALANCIVAPEDRSTSENPVVVNNAAELNTAINNLANNQSILLQPGVYNLVSTLYIQRNNVSIVGNSANCDDVILVGNGMENPDYGNVPHGIWTNAENLTIKNLTIKNVYFHAINYNPGAESPVVYNVSMIDIGQQFIKANPVAFGDGVDFGTVEYSSMLYTVAPPTTDHGGGTGYTNGVDVHAGEGWEIRNNVFQNFHTPDNADNLWNPAVLMWNGARDTIVENNQFIDVDRAIAFGLEDRAYDHSGGAIINNMISYRPGLYSASRTSQSDAAIIAWSSPGALIAHNTILINGNLSKSIEHRFETQGLTIKNNFIDAPVGSRNDSVADTGDNMSITDNSIFLDSNLGNLRLTQELEPEYMVQHLDSAPIDFDGNVRNTFNDIYPGAVQYQAINRPSPPTDVTVTY